MVRVYLIMIEKVSMLEYIATCLEQELHHMYHVKSPTFAQNHPPRKFSFLKNIKRASNFVGESQESLPDHTNLGKPPESPRDV